MKVRHRTALLVLVACLPLAAQASSTYRCGSALVSKGDHSGVVLTKCGEPASRDFLGYREVIDRYGLRNEVPIEEWVYGPRNGMYHFLRFEAGRLEGISSRRGN
ncbi:DUF2845 domain-containing protein [Pseudomonas sp. NCCP-436]|uniref:DUF2845 domain-containing protein n=1 Tax=Pseudomonas sp. NCCP-436 TaxID=2842481 RepID=UPI001E120623|nr:hypothetical protein NCCP436_30280 [Pseudomonas sp. NCCP-436]